MKRPPAVILAGGRSRRMGVPDKCLLPLGSMTIIEHVHRTLAPQVSRVAVSSNSDPAKFDFLGLPVLPDTLPGFQGPLAGILTGMLWARECQPDADCILSVPGDVPFLPVNLVEKLLAARDGADMVIARSAGRAHPTIGLWPVSQADRLVRHLSETSMRKVTQWLGQFLVREVEFPVNFANINSAEDLSHARLAYPMLDRTICVTL